MNLASRILTDVQRLYLQYKNEHPGYHTEFFNNIQIRMLPEQWDLLVSEKLSDALFTGPRPLSYGRSLLGGIPVELVPYEQDTGFYVECNIVPRRIGGCFTYEQ